MAYYDIDVIVEGALDKHEVIDSEKGMAQLLSSIREDSKDGLHTEVYVMYHAHSPRECECAQYVTDHHPDYEYNAPS